MKEREIKVEERKEVQVELAPVRELEPPARLSTGSISDVVSGSSPDTKGKLIFLTSTLRLFCFNC